MVSLFKVCRENPKWERRAKKRAQKKEDVFTLILACKPYIHLEKHHNQLVVEAFGLVAYLTTAKEPPHLLPLNEEGHAPALLLLRPLTSQGFHPQAEELVACLVARLSLASHTPGLTVYPVGTFKGLACEGKAGWWVPPACFIKGSSLLPPPLHITTCLPNARIPHSTPTPLPFATQVYDAQWPRKWSSQASASSHVDACREGGPGTCGQARGREGGAK